MPMTLEQYSEYLESRDLTWPQPPAAQLPKAKPAVAKLPGIRLVAWNTYGTLLNIFGGQLLWEHPQKFVMDIALGKTVEEFKMWGSMSRKPGQPSEYMGELFRRELDQLKMAPSPGEKYPEIQTEKVWEGIVKKLLQKDYKFDTGFYGSLNEFSRKIAYFFHASLQGTACYDTAAQAIQHIQACGVKQALLGDGQCFTPAQLQRGLAAQNLKIPIELLFDPRLRALSVDVASRKPSERLFRHFLGLAQQQGIAPNQILHVGSRIPLDIAPAKKLGMRTALFAGDKESLQATADQLKDPATRPEVMITELRQLADVVQ